MLMKAHLTDEKMHVKNGSKNLFSQTFLTSTKVLIGNAYLSDFYVLCVKSPRKIFNPAIKVEKKIV